MSRTERFDRVVCADKFHTGLCADMAASALDDSRTSDATVARIAQWLKSGHVPGSLTRVEPKADSFYAEECRTQNGICEETRECKYHLLCHPPVHTVTAPWWRYDLSIEARRRAYAQQGYPAIAQAQEVLLSFEQEHLVDELRPYRVRPTDPGVQVRILDSRGFIADLTDPTEEGARELAEQECVGEFQVVKIDRR